MSISIIFLSFSYFFISFLGILIATYTDLKDRIIPNKLTYSLIFLGIALHALESFTVSSFWPLLTSIALTVATFAFSWLLWKAGVWAGGDVKLFTGIAALNPFNPNLLAGLGIQVPLFASIAIPIFPLTLFIFSIFAAAPFGVVVGANALSRKPVLRKKIFTDFSNAVFQTHVLKKRVFQAGLVAAALVGAASLFELLSLSTWLFLPFLFLFGLLPKNPRIALAAVCLALRELVSAVHCHNCFVSCFKAVPRLKRSAQKGNQDNTT